MGVSRASAGRNFAHARASLSRGRIAPLCRELWKMKFYRVASFSLVLCFALASLASARVRMMPNAPAGAGGMVNLPYQVQDSQGTTWMLYGSGWLQQQGNMPVYSQAAILSINQKQPTMNVNQARLDAKTREGIFENMPCMNTMVTRRDKICKNAS